MGITAAYLRSAVSPNIDGITRQREMVRALAVRDNKTITREFVDLASGMRIDHPALTELRALAAQGEVETLYLASYDRLSRDWDLVGRLTDELTAHGVVLVTE